MPQTTLYRKIDGDASSLEDDARATPAAPSGLAQALLALRPARLRAKRASVAIPEGTPGPEVLGRDALYRRTLAQADVLAVALAVLLALVVIGDSQPAVGSLLALPLLIVISKVVGLYDRDEHVLRKTTIEEVPTLFSVATLFVLTFWLFDGLSAHGALGRPEVLSLWALVFLFMVVARSTARSLVRRITPVERCLVLGDDDAARSMRRKFELSFSVSAMVVGRVPLVPEPGGARNRNGRPRVLPGPPMLGTLETLGLVLLQHDIHRVIVVPSMAESEQTLEAIRVVRALGVRVSIVPRMLEVVGSSVEFDEVDGVTMLGLHGSRLSRSSGVVKRGMDIVGSATVLLLLSPLLALIAAAVKLNSPGPVLFRQKRIGRGGRQFDMLKFRSMRDGADAEKEALLALNETQGLFKIADDPRVTRVGRFLRRRSLDELPQLLNVLRGEMSLVGPRPLVPEDDAQVQGWERDRLALSPGMTGQWQILGSTRVPLEEMVKIDYLYGANWSLWTDLKILLRTALYVAGARSA